MPFTYRPMLKTKAGEAVALGQLAAADKARIAPVFHIAENPPATFAARLGDSWNGRTCYLDGAFNFNIAGSSAAFDALFTALGGNGVLVLPVIEIDATGPYNQAAFSHLNQFAQGLMLKCTLGTLPQTQSYAQQMQVPTSHIDLLVDAGHIAEFDPASFSPYVAQALSTNLHGSAWRSVTLASSAAPKDFGQLGLGTTMVRRIDWLTWAGLHQNAHQPIDYADFGISHRDMTEPPGPAMARATVSVKYTIDDNWIMIKGRSVSGAQGAPMADQYRNHARALYARPEFNGLADCWGDRRIGQIATIQSVSPGGRTQWVEINANRHLAFIVSRLP